MSAIEQSETDQLIINDEYHNVTMSLTNEESIVIEIVELSTQLKYKSIFIKDDFIEVIQRRIQLSIKQFYEVLTSALTKEDPDMILKGEQGLTNGVKLTLTWKINNKIGLELPLIFPLEIAPLIQSDGERMDLITRSVNQKLIQQDALINRLTDLTNAQQQLINQLSTQLTTATNNINTLTPQLTNATIDITNLTNQLTNANNTITILSKKQNNIVNVSLFKDDVREAFANPVFNVTVNKKSSTSTLIVQANLCVHGENNAETCPIITYGDTTTYGQSEGYANNSGYGRSLMCYAVIKGHTIIGNQNLSMTFKHTPYAIKNPNVTDHVNYTDTQPCSVIRVEELEL